MSIKQITGDLTQNQTAALEQRWAAWGTVTSPSRRVLLVNWPMQVILSRSMNYGVIELEVLAMVWGNVSAPIFMAIHVMSTPTTKHWNPCYIHPSHLVNLLIGDDHPRPGSAYSLLAKRQEPEHRCPVTWPCYCFVPECICPRCW